MNLDTIIMVLMATQKYVEQKPSVPDTPDSHDGEDSPDGSESR